MKLMPLILVACLAGPAIAQGTAPTPVPPAKTAPMKKPVKHMRKQKKEKKMMPPAPAPAPQS
jgi:hypothetical protein